MEWMHGGGRDPHGRGLDEEIRIGKEDWLERQKGVPQRVGFKHGGSWADWQTNHSDQMTFEEYLRMDMDKPVHPIDKSTGGSVSQLVQPGPGRQGYKGEGSGSGQPGKIRVPLNEEELKVARTVYGVETEKELQKLFPDTFKDIKSNIRRKRLTLKSKPHTGFGTGTGLTAMDNPKYYDIVTAELNKIKKQRHKVEFFDWKEGDEWYKGLKTRLKGMNREHMNKLLNKVVAEEFPLAYAGKEGRAAYKRKTIVDSFLAHLEMVGEFDGNEKGAKILQQFQSGHPDHKFEEINKAFRKWVDGEFEVRGVDRSKLNKGQLEEIKNWKPRNTQARSLIRENQLKYLHGLNNTRPGMKLDDIHKMFKNKFPDAPPNAFWHRIDQLTQLKRTGEVVSGLNTTKSYNWNVVDPDGRSAWMKEGFGRQFQGNYSKLINEADRLRGLGGIQNLQDAVRLEKAADKFFGPKGIFTIAGGQGEHPLSRLLGGVDQQLKINSLVSGDLNQFKRLNFDEPVMKLMNDYAKTKPDSPERLKIIEEIEGRKKLMNILTEGKTEKGIVDSVKFNYGDKKIGPSTSVMPIDKLDELGKFNVEDFVKRGQSYSSEFIKKGVKVGKLLTDVGTIKTEALDFGQIKKLLTKLGCGMYAGGRVGLAVGSGKCITRAVAKLKSGDLSVAEKKIVDALGDGLGKGGGMPKKGWTMKSLVKGEGYFALADFANNLTKGQDLDKSFSNAVKTATFGLLDLKGTERDLMKYAKERGIDPKDMKEWMEYAKTYGKYVEGHEDLAEREKIVEAYGGEEEYWKNFQPNTILNPSADFSDPSLWDAEHRIKKAEEQIKEQQKAESIQSGKGYEDLNEMIEGVVANEWNKTAGTPLDRGYRKMLGMKGDEGLVWGPIGNLFREGAEKLGFEEHKALKSFKPQKVMNYHPAYGYKEDIKEVMREGDSPMEDMLMFMEKYYPRSGLVEEAYRDKLGTYDYDKNLYAGGGIAGLLKK